MGFFGKLFGSRKEEEQKFIMQKMPELPFMSQPMQMPIIAPPPVTLAPHEVKGAFFVRLDSFEHAEQFFKDSKSKLEEIEAEIKSVDDINAKEDERLLSWAKDLEKVKMLLNRIDEKVFYQI